MMNSLLLMFLLLLCFHVPIGTSRTHADADSTALIQSACKSTMHYELCISCLASDPSSSNADTKGLALIMLHIAISNATSTSSYLSSQAKLTATNPNIKGINKLCAQKYSNAATSLQSSLRELAADQFDYAYLHVMAAADYPRACRTSFCQVPGLPYLPDLASREDSLVHICEVVLGIFDFLLGSAT